MTRARSLIVCAVAALSLAAQAPARPATSDKPIQPGAFMTAPAGCTLNFVFAGSAGRRYIGTAGHCVSAVGDTVLDAGGAPIGTVVFRSFEGVGAGDFSLIQIDPVRVAAGDVNPAVRGWGGPTGHTTSTATARGDRLLLHGHGLLFGNTETTRSRPGVLLSDTPRWYKADLPAIFGDSGGPIMRSDGKALGTVSGIAPGGLPPPTLLGPTIEDALAMLRAAGIVVSLMTAPYAPLVP